VAARLQQHHFKEVYTQVPLTVAHGTFSKTYRLDLVVSGMVYELKTVVALAREHDAQAIHYAALLGIDRVKLLNFRPAKVTGKLVRCPVGRLDRSQVRFIQRRWQPLSAGCELLKGQMSALLADWGAYLQAQLYEEALVHFSGGESVCARRVRVVRDGLELGTHRMQCHADQIAFLVTAMTQDHHDYEQHLLRLIRFTCLQAVQWINLNHADVELVTLRNGKGMEARE
jgi:GxxExxY protein